MALGVGRPLTIPRERGEWVAFSAASVVVLAAGAWPLATVAADLGSADLDVLFAARTWGLFGITLVRTLAVVAGTLVIGVPLGLLLGRTDVAGRRAALALHAFPAFVPPFLLALGWFHGFGRGGALGSEHTAALLFAEPGVVATLVLAFSPVVTVLVALALEAIDPALEEAGLVVASPGRVAVRILLPIARPAAALGAIIVFALAFGELGVPMFLRVPAYPAAVFARLGATATSTGEAFALVLPLVGVAVGLIAIERGVGRRAEPVLGPRRARGPLALSRWRVALSLFVWAAVGLGLVPLGLLALKAFPAIGALSTWIGDSLGNSLVPAALAATAITALGAILGWSLARRRPGTRLIDAAATLAFVTPAAVLGVGLIATWNRPATAAMYASTAILVVGYVARYAVLGIRPVAALVAQSPRSFEDAAEISGAPWRRRFLRIVVPLHARRLGAVWLLALVFCLRDLEGAVLYYPAGGAPLTVLIFTLEANGPPAVVAGLSLLQVAMTGAILAGAGLLLRRRA